MRGRRVLALLFTLLLLPAPSGSAAEAPAELGWSYVVRVDDAERGILRVDLHFTGLEDRIDKFTFRTADHAYPILDVTSDTATLRPVDVGVELPVDGDEETLTFLVDVRRRALGEHGDDSTGDGRGYSSWVGPAFGVFKGEALALGFTYTYYEGRPFTWRATVQFDLPDGWQVEAPWARTGDVSFDLPDGQTLPRGYVAMGAFRDHVTWEAHDREFRYVRLGNATSYDDELPDYVADATPYYESVYGEDAAGAIVLAVSAPSPMFEGGLGGSDSFYVHEDAQLRTVAHEYAHVWQLFSSQPTPGDATIWVTEGDADYHSALSLLATERWSLDEVNDFLRRGLDRRNEPAFERTPLSQATYGNGADGDVAYQKGALVMHAIHGIIRKETDGTRGIADVLQALNEAHDQRVQDDDPEAAAARRSPVHHAELLRVLAETTRLDFEPFFNRFVHDTKWPAFEEVVPRDGIVLTDLTLDPAEATENETVTATVTLVNRGLEPGEKRLVLTLGGETPDGAPVQTVPLRVGERATVQFHFRAPAPGAHEVRVDYLTTTLRVLTPPDVHLERVSMLPNRPQAREPVEALVYLRNDGEQAGSVPLEVRVDGGLVKSVTSPDVPANLSQALPVPLTFEEAGMYTVEVTIHPGTPNAETAELVAVVAPPDRDDDGVPDDEDAYPDNAELSDRNTVNDVRNTVPAPAGAAAAALALAGLAGTWRRRGLNP